MVRSMIRLLLRVSLSVAGVHRRRRTQAAQPTHPSALRTGLFGAAQHLRAADAARGAAGLLPARGPRLPHGAGARRRHQDDRRAARRHRSHQPRRHAVPGAGRAQGLRRRRRRHRVQQSDLQPGRQAGDQDLCRSQGQADRACRRDRLDHHLDPQAAGDEGHQPGRLPLALRRRHARPPRLPDQGRLRRRSARPAAGFRGDAAAAIACSGSPPRRCRNSSTR